MMKILGWMEHPWRNVSLRVGDSFVKIENLENGSGEVKARFSHDPHSNLMLIPLESTPPSPQATNIREKPVKYAIASAISPNTYLHMHGSRLFENMKIEPQGGGEVNCQSSVRSRGMFYVNQDIENKVNIQSVAYPNVFLRVNARSGSVNAQWTAGESERFQICHGSTGVPFDVDDGVADANKRLKQEVADRDAEILRLKANATLAQAKADSELGSVLAWSGVELTRLEEELDRTRDKLARMNEKLARMKDKLART